MNPYGGTVLFCLAGFLSIARGHGSAQRVSVRAFSAPAALPRCTAAFKPFWRPPLTFPCLLRVPGKGRKDVPIMIISEEVMLYCSTHTIADVEYALLNARRRAESLRRLYRDESSSLSISERADRYWVNIHMFETLATELEVCLEAMYEDRDRPPFDPN